MISVYYKCNGCGLYTEYKGKNEKQLNVISIDLTNYLLLTSGFRMKEPWINIHFCDDCYSQIMKGSCDVAALGDVEILRKKIETLEEEKIEIQKNFDNYKFKVKDLLK